MLHTLFKPLFPLTLVFALLAPGAQPVSAVAPVTSSPEKPLAYSDKWVDIQPGEYQWYAFKYRFDDSGDNPMQPSQIRLDTKPDEGVSLELMNGEQVKAWEHGEKLQNFGAATTEYDTIKVKVHLDDFCNENPTDPICHDNNGDGNAVTKCVNKRDPANTDSECIFKVNESRGYATWAGVIGASGTYYILVRRPAKANGPAQYRFTIGGDGLTMK